MGPHGWLVLFALVAFGVLVINLAKSHEMRPFFKAVTYLVGVFLLAAYVIRPLAWGWVLGLTVVMFALFCLVVILAVVDLPNWGFVGDFEVFIWEDARGTARIRWVRRGMAALFAVVALTCGVVWAVQAVASPSSGVAAPTTSAPSSIGSTPPTTTTTSPPPLNCGAPALTEISPQIEVPFDPAGVEKCSDGKWVAVSATELPSKVTPIARGERDGRQYFKLKDRELVIRAARVTG